MGVGPVTEAFICDAVCTPIGRYGVPLAAVRADDLAAVPMAALHGPIRASSGPRWTT